MVPIVADAASGQPKVVLRTDKGESAEIYLHGGHLTSWRAGGGERLFLSSRALFQPPKAIRGGVPVCFPQFGALGPLAQQHGFARNSRWEVEGGSPTDATLVLKSSGTEAADYPHPFELRTTVELHDGSLSQSLAVTNTGDAPLAFTCALHTYLAVADIAAASVTGLQGCRYRDSLRGRQAGEALEERPAVTFQQEVDRIYVGVPRQLALRAGAAGCSVDIALEGFPDAVVWNPWVDKAQAMPDFGDEEYRRMVCVEPALAASGPILLPPGRSWTGRQLLTCRQD